MEYRESSTACPNRKFPAKAQRRKEELPRIVLRLLFSESSSQSQMETKQERGPQFILLVSFASLRLCGKLLLVFLTLQLPRPKRVARDARRTSCVLPLSPMRTGGRIRNEE